MPILRNDTVLVPTLSKGNDSARSELERQREASFNKFLKDLYVTEPINGDMRQLKKLLDHLYNEIERQGIVKNKGGALRTQRNGAVDKADLGLLSLREAFDKFTTIRGGETSKIVLDCKDMLERIAYLIIHDQSNTAALKEQAILDLIDPLVECKEGAQGEIQSKYLLLNSLNLEEQLGLFAKDIVEKIFLRTLSEAKKKNNGNITIHTRNRYFWYASKGLSILGAVEEDKYKGGVTEDGAMSEIRASIDDEYSVDKFLASITSSIRSNLSDIRLQFNAKPEYTQKLLRCLAFIGINPEDLDSVFSSKIKMPYTVLSGFLTSIHAGKIEKYDCLTDMPANLDHDSSHFYILNKNNVISFVIGSKTYEIARKQDNPDLFEKLLGFYTAKRPLSELESIFNDQLYRDGKVDHVSPYIGVDEYVLAWKILDAMYKQGLLKSKKEDEKLSAAFGNERLLSAAKRIEINLSLDIKCVVYPFAGSEKLFFEKQGKYVTPDVLFADEKDAAEIKQTINNMDVEQFVSFIMMVDSVYSVDINAWLIKNPNRFNELLAFLSNLDTKDKTKFFSSSNFSLLIAAKGDDQRIAEMFDHYINSIDFNQLKSITLKGNNEHTKEYHYKLMKKLIARDNFDPTSFISMLAISPEMLKIWFEFYTKGDPYSSEVLATTANLFAILETSADELVNFLSLPGCKQLMLSGGKTDLSKELLQQFEKISNSVSAENCCKLFFDESSEEGRIRNDILIKNIVGNESFAAEDLINVLAKIAKEKPEFFKRFWSSVQNQGEFTILLQRVSGHQAKFFGIDIVKEIVATGKGGIISNYFYDKTLPRLHLPGFNRLFVTGENSEHVEYNDLLVNYAVDSYSYDTAKLKKHETYGRLIKFLVDLATEKPKVFDAWFEKNKSTFVSRVFKKYGNEEYMTSTHGGNLIEIFYLKQVRSLVISDADSDFKTFFENFAYKLVPVDKLHEFISSGSSDKAKSYNLKLAQQAFLSQGSKFTDTLVDFFVKDIKVFEEWIKLLSSEELKAYVSLSLKGKPSAKLLGFLALPQFANVFSEKDSSEARTYFHSITVISKTKFKDMLKAYIADDTVYKGVMFNILDDSRWADLIFQYKEFLIEILHSKEFVVEMTSVHEKLDRVSVILMANKKSIYVRDYFNMLLSKEQLDTFEHGKMYNAKIIHLMFDNLDNYSTSRVINLIFDQDKKNMSDAADNKAFADLMARVLSDKYLAKIILAKKDKKNNTKNDFLIKFLRTSTFVTAIASSSDGLDFASNFVNQNVKLISFNDLFNALFKNDELEAPANAAAYNLKLTSLMLNNFASYNASQKITLTDWILKQNESDPSFVKKLRSANKDLLLTVVLALNAAKERQKLRLFGYTLRTSSKGRKMGMIEGRLSHTFAQLRQEEQRNLAANKEFSKTHYEKFIDQLPALQAFKSDNAMLIAGNQKKQLNLMSDAFYAEFLSSGDLGLANVYTADNLATVEDLLLKKYPQGESLENINDNLTVFFKTIILILKNEEYKELINKFAAKQLSFVDLLKQSFKLTTNKDIESKDGEPGIDAVIRNVQQEISTIEAWYENALANRKAAEAKARAEAEVAAAAAAKANLANTPLKKKPESKPQDAGSGVAANVTSALSAAAPVVFNAGVTVASTALDLSGSVVKAGFGALNRYMNQASAAAAAKEGSGSAVKQPIVAKPAAPVKPLEAAESIQNRMANLNTNQAQVAASTAQMKAGAPQGPINTGQTIAQRKAAFEKPKESQVKAVKPAKTPGLGKHSGNNDQV